MKEIQEMSCPYSHWTGELSESEQLVCVSRLWPEVDLVRIKGT